MIFPFLKSKSENVVNSLEKSVFRFFRIKCYLSQANTDRSTNPLYKNISGNKSWKVLIATEVETFNHWNLLTGENLNEQISGSPVDYFHKEI